MRAYPDCYTCIYQQTLNAARLAGANEMQQAEIMRQVAGVLQRSPAEFTPADIVDLTNPIICQVSGAADPYREIRQAGLEQALAIYPQLQQLVAAAPDPLEAAVRLAIVGNIIDIIPGHTYDLWGVIQQALEQPIHQEHLEQFRAAAQSARCILYLADNAGEAVFDRLLLEQLPRVVTYAVKSAPILNDAVLADAQAAGIEQVASVIPTGSGAPGTILTQCSPAFLSIYHAADLVISKGQANYETLDDQGGRVFFLLKVKCPIIGRQFGAQVGDLVIQQGR
jgi:hypothetical protein